MNIDGMTLLIHIAAGGVALIFGFIALFAAKGASLHRRSGIVFVFAMVTLGLTGAVVAVLHDIAANVIGGVLSAYMVVTALTTLKKREERSRRLDVAAIVVAFAIAAASLAIAMDAISAGRGSSDGATALMYMIFGTISLLSGISDIRVMRAGGVQGTRRIRRHLWRMCFALFIASGSYFLGQADTIPKPLRIYPLLSLAALLPLFMMFFWLWRVRTGRRSGLTIPINAVPERT